MITNNDDITIIYDKIKIRTLSIADCKPYYVNWLNDPRVHEFLETRHSPQTLDSIKEYVSKVSLDLLSYHFAIILSCNNRHIGNIKLGPVDLVHRVSDISYFIGDVPSWGCGYAYQAIQAVLIFAFENLDLKRIQASCYESNIGSINLLKKCGFSKEGVLRNRFIDINDQRSSSYIYGILQEEFNE